MMALRCSLAAWALAGVCAAALGGGDPVQNLAASALKGDRQAEQALEARAQQGEVSAQYSMGMLFLSGKGAGRSDERALDWFERAAAAGHVESAHNAAVIRERGPASVRDMDKALAWYRLAAQAGYARSQANLGRLLVHGKHPEDGIAWLEKARAQGEPLAFRELGLVYLERKDLTPTDPGKAASLLGVAAAKGDALAQYRLATLYGAGLGVARDEAVALDWMGKAAAQRQPDAEYFMAAMESRKHNDAASVDWLRRASRHGHAEAQYRLGLDYAEGRGVAKDGPEALGWLQQAARNGHPEAARAVREITERMPSEQLDRLP